MKSFPKSVRLNSKIQIEDLFNNGDSFVLENFKVYFDSKQTKDPSVSILISVPKKLIPLASKRNKIKRLIKESYRKNKSDLLVEIKNKNIELNIILILLKLEFDNYKSAEQKIKLILQRLTKQI